MNIGIVGQGYVGTAVKEVFSKHYNVETYDLDKDKCLFCGACIGVCPTNAMLLEYNERNIWINEDCTDCLFCTRVCPVGALSYPEEPSRNTTFEAL